MSDENHFHLQEYAHMISFGRFDQVSNHEQCNSCNSSCSSNITANSTPSFEEGKVKQSQLSIKKSMSYQDAAQPSEKRFKPLSSSNSNSSFVDNKFAYPTPIRRSQSLNANCLPAEPNNFTSMSTTPSTAPNINQFYSTLKQFIINFDHNELLVNHTNLQKLSANDIDIITQGVIIPPACSGWKKASSLARSITNAPPVVENKNSKFMLIKIEKELEIKKSLKSNFKHYIGFLILFHAQDKTINKFLITCDSCKNLVSSMPNHSSIQFPKNFVHFNIFVEFAETQNYLFYNNMFVMLNGQQSLSSINHASQTIKTCTQMDKFPVSFNIFPHQFSFLPQLYHFIYSQSPDATLNEESTFLLSNNNRQNFIKSTFIKVQTKRRQRNKALCNHCQSNNDVISCMSQHLSICHHKCRQYKSACHLLTTYKSIQIIVAEGSDYNIVIGKHFHNVFFQQHHIIF